MLPEWRTELVRLAVGLMLAVLTGSVIGKTVPLVIGVLAVALCWYLWQLFRLQCWLNHKLPQAPQAGGVWGKIFAGLVVDKRRSKENRERLSKIITRFRDVTQALPDGVVVLGNSNEIKAINSAATFLLGIRLPQDHGQNIGNYIRDPDVTRFLDHEQDDSTLIIRSPGNFHTRVSLRQVIIGKTDFGHKLIIARDVTRLHQLERVRQDFIANVSHELRTPLTVITGYMEMLLSDHSDQDKTMQQQLTRISQQTARLTSIVDDLLNLSTLESSEPPDFTEIVDMPALLARCLQQARELSLGQHTFSSAIDEQLGIRGNAHELESVVSNLLSNAVRYTPQQGKISIQWSKQTEAVELQIKDSGIGIPARDLSRLTQRFYRVDPGRSRETGGTGLGLAIVKHILDRHGASLQIDSQPDRGSSFSCQFRKDLAVGLDSSSPLQIRVAKHLRRTG